MSVQQISFLLVLLTCLSMLNQVVLTFQILKATKTLPRFKLNHARCVQYSRKATIAPRLNRHHTAISSSVISQYNRLDAPKAIPYFDVPPVIVGIAGGSASGKTTFTRKIIEALGEDHVAVISHDNYYKDLRHLSLEARANVNFDHPDSLDSQLLTTHLLQLKSGEAVDIPTYDFKTHSRSDVVSTIEPKRIILIDGILIFSEKELVELMDMKIFVDTDDDIRLIRRIKRDTIERQRTVESIIDQYIKTVRPMHQLYVEPSKRIADIIVPAGQGIQPVALEMCLSRMREIINVYQ